MRKRDKLAPEERKIQRTLTKLMSEEMCAHMLYEACTLAAVRDVDKLAQTTFTKMFADIALDEYKDHFAQLREWAMANGYDVPFSMREWQKADERGAKQLDSLKRGEPPSYYLKQAIESEKAAIASYSDIVGDLQSTASKAEAADGSDVPYELAAICLRNYFDEISHLEQFSAMLNAAEAGADLMAY